MTKEDFLELNEEQQENFITKQQETASGWDSFEGAFTWQNIGLQVANGIISGGASWALGALLSSISKKDDNLESMLQRFADNIVSRVTSNVRALIYENNWKENIRGLKVSSKSLTKKYRSYELTKEPFWLNATLEHSVDAVEEAYDLGVNALGLFTTVAGIKMLAYRKASDDYDNQGYIREVVLELPELIKHIDKIIAQIEKSARETIGPAFNHIIRDEESGRILLKGLQVTIDNTKTYYFYESNAGVLISREEAQEQAFQKYFAPTKKDIIDPANKIKNRWEKLLEDLCEQHADLCKDLNIESSN